MSKKVHATAGVIGFLTILIFWTSTVYSEVFGSPETIAFVKASVLKGMFILIPTMITIGVTGMKIGNRRKDKPALAKKKRMPVIAANGLLILLPSAIFLSTRAGTENFDAAFYLVQTGELIAGGLNLALMGLNIRDGRAMADCRNG